AQLGELLEADFLLAARDQLRDQHAGRRLRHALLQLRGDAQALEQPREVYPARAARVADRFRAAQRACEGRDRGEVGPGRALLHADRHARLHDVDAAAARELARLDELVDQ